MHGLLCPAVSLSGSTMIWKKKPQTHHCGLSPAGNLFDTWTAYRWIRRGEGWWQEWRQVGFAEVVLRASVGRPKKGTGILGEQIKTGERGARGKQLIATLTFTQENKSGWELSLNRLNNLLLSGEKPEWSWSRMRRWAAGVESSQGGRKGRPRPHPAWKWEKMQLFYWPLEAGSKHESASIGSHVKGDIRGKYHYFNV